MLTLTGCSSLSVVKPETTSFVDAPIIHPPRPRPVQLFNERWYACGEQICMSPADAKKMMQNKAEIARFMREMDNLVEYYRQLQPKS